MARSGNVDPLTRYKFTVYIKVGNDQSYFQKLSFMSVTPPRVDISTDQYSEFGRHLNPHSITEGATFSPVTLRRGKAFSKDFLNWIGLVYKAFYGDEVGETENYRGTVVIDHHDRRGNVIKKYVLENARPTGYIPVSKFDAMDDSEVSIETLTLEYEGYLEKSVNENQLLNVLGSAANQILGEETTLAPGFDDISI